MNGPFPPAAWIRWEALNSLTPRHRPPPLRRRGSGVDAVAVGEHWKVLDVVGFGGSVAVIGVDLDFFFTI
jgi:hypothetical protein